MIENVTSRTAGFGRVSWQPVVGFRNTASGPQTSRPGASRRYRGSRKRLKRLTLHASIELWVFVVLMLFLVFVVVPWMIRHPPEPHHQAPQDGSFHLSRLMFRVQENALLASVLLGVIS